MKIGELAKQAGVGIDTVRYYEREGVLPSPQREGSGYRHYNVNDVARLQFIRRAKTLGFSLKEISELLLLSGRSHDDMHIVRQAAETKLRDVQNKLEELARIKQGLDLLIAACPGHGEIGDCPIVAALSSADGALASREKKNPAINSTKPTRASEKKK
ncbi:MAG: MerR family transcriptional regulator [Arenimonas sp.]